ncbi:MAG TPA: VWA domain-containing protein [Candidatus Limnocylindrales bacterium]|nr:VWA domain-containing protein [Candidatus Limnocylindrales bacterium]
MTAQSVEPAGGALLLDPMLRLVTKLRDAGVPVSSSEVIDATSALNAIDVLDREQVRAAMAATLVKRAEDRPAFEVMFELLFAVRRGARPGDAPPPGNERRQITTSLDRVTLSGDEPGEGAADLLDLIMEAIRRGDPEALRALAEMAVDRYGGMGTQPDASERYFLYRVLRALELSKLMGEMLRAEVEEGRDEPKVREELADRIEAFKKLIASEVRSQLAEARGPDDTTRAMELLGTEDVDFLGASPRQLAAMREAIRPLARALATKMARRRRRRDRGRLDVRRTVRRSLSSGGVLLDPAFRRPKVARPDLYLLCDVSGSVAEFASFTLTLLQAMTSEFSRMRSFAFVDGIDEVTDHLKDVASFLEVRHVLYRANVVRDDGHSDYGSVFERFNHRHGSAIDSRSTIIVTGDARSNYREPQAEILRELHARARRVYLLNPEPEGEWDTTDSIVSAYRPMLDGIFEVRNLRQLGDAIYRIT